MLYIGPDVLMPVASAIAAVAGFLLMFWHRTVAFVSSLIRFSGGPSGGKMGVPARRLT